MNYETFIRKVAKATDQPVPDRLWHRIDQTITERRAHPVAHTLTWLFPKAVLVGAVVGILAVVIADQVRTIQLDHFMRTFYSTDYIYEQSKYPSYGNFMEKSDV